MNRKPLIIVVLCAAAILAAFVYVKKSSGSSAGGPGGGRPGGQQMSGSPQQGGSGGNMDAAKGNGSSGDKKGSRADKGSSEDAKKTNGADKNASGSERNSSGDRSSSGNKNSSGKNKNGNYSAASENLVSVKTQAAVKNVLHDYVNTNGEIESKSKVAVYPDIGGKVYMDFVGLGSVVKKGDPIAEIDPSEPGSYYTHSKVLAPVSGTVIASVVDAGTKVTTQSVITTIGDVNNLQLKVNIVERYVGYIKKGLKANVTLDAYEGETWTATVVKVSPVLDATSRTKEVILDFDKKDERINAGMFAKVTLWTVDYSGKVTVPVNCVVTKGKQNYVFVLSEDGTKAIKREVTLGHSVDDQVQAEGIEEGERVVVEGMSVLADGSLVREINND